MRKSPAHGLSGRALLRGLFLFLVGVCIVLSVLAATVNSVTLNGLRPRLCANVSSITGRRCVINGDLTLYWRRGVGTGWLGWLPQPHIRLKDVRFGNPSWAATGPDMARADQVDVRLSLPPLMHGELDLIPQQLLGPSLILERGPDGQGNWHIPKRPNVHWNLRELHVEAGAVRYADTLVQTDVTLGFRRGHAPDSVDWSVEGHLGQDAVMGTGTLGGVSSLAARAMRYPVEASLTIGKTRLSANGDIIDPFGKCLLDLHLGMVGASLAQLYPFTGLLLSETPRFSLEGRLKGSLASEDFHLRFEQFHGLAGSSDIAGMLEYRRRSPRPLLSADVSSARLDWKDLAPLLGRDASPVRKQRGAPPRQRPDKVFPVEPFRTDRWHRIDAQVRLSVDRFIWSGGPTLQTSSVSADLTDGVLTLAPLQIGLADGRIEANLKIDGNTVPPGAQLTVTAQRLKLHHLFPGISAIGRSHSELQARARLSANGDSIAALLAAANGDASVVVGQGSISRYALDAIGLNVGGLVWAKLFGDSQVRLDCAVADFGVEKGVMQSRVFVVDTEEAILRVDSRIDLARELLALDIQPQSKGIQLMSLRAPLHVRGSFRHPSVSADKEAVTLKAGAAAALGLVASPLAALLPLLDPGTDEGGNPCARHLGSAANHPPATATGR